MSCMWRKTASRTGRARATVAAGRSRLMRVAGKTVDRYRRCMWRPAGRNLWCVCACVQAMRTDDSVVVSRGREKGCPQFSKGVQAFTRPFRPRSKQLTLLVRKHNV